MVAIPRQSHIVEEPHPSSQVAISTVVGMVLGILCLFGIVLIFQLWPRKPKISRPPNHRPPKEEAKTISPLQRFLGLFSRDTGGKARAQRNAPGPDIYPKPVSTRRRALRSFYLSSEKENRKKNIREKFSTTLRLNVEILRIKRHNLLSPSPRTPLSRGSYVPLNDKDADPCHPNYPESAMLSPWSLSEYDYPDTAPLVIRKRHDPLSQLPRVYVPETPTRNGGYPFERETHIPQVESKESLIDPFMLEPKEPLEELRDVVVRIAREHRSDIDRNVFVIGNEWDSGSDDGSFDELKL